jgi:hypothetical protein
LLTKRAALFNEAEHIRDRPAEIRKDIGAIDRTWSVLGCSAAGRPAMPRQKWKVTFGRGEDARDCKYLSDLTKSVTKQLRQMQEDGG